MAEATPLPLNLLSVGDDAADMVEVNSVVADSIETCIVDDTFGDKDVDVDIDVDVWVVEAEDGSAEEEAVMAERTQSEHAKGVRWLSRVPN